MVREPQWIDLLQFVTDTEGTEYRIRARGRGVFCPGGEFPHLLR